MSTLEPHTQGLVVPRHIGRRITEIMEEKGKAYTQQAIAIRIGMNKQTLSKKLRGDRDMYMFELRRIAEALNLTVERVLQEDTIELEEELKSIFQALIDPSQVEETANKIHWSEAASAAYASGGNIEVLKQRALEIAQKLSSIAIGVTEKSVALNDLGRAYFHLNRFNEAHTIWLEAFCHAKKIAEKTNVDKEPLVRIVANLTISYSNRNEYTGLAKIITYIEQIAEKDANRSGIIYYSLAKISEHNGEFEQAREYYYKSLDAYYNSGVPFNIAKSEHNTACFEFRLGDYLASKLLFEKALPILQQYEINYEVTCLKDYCKTLMKLGEYQKVEEITTEILQRIFPKEFTFLKAKILIIHSMVTSDPKFAESVFDMEVNHNLKLISCNFLMDFYNRKGDSQQLMKYYRISTDIQTCDILSKEEL